jgi:hypothetical protein
MFCVLCFVFADKIKLIHFYLIICNKTNYYGFM